VTAPHPDISEAPGNLLAPEPIVRTGALIGYARVSTSGQLLDRQQHALAGAGCLRVFADKLSGKDADRPELAACLDYLRPGDTLVVPNLDRLSRSLTDLIAIVGTLRRQGVGFKSLHEALDTTTPGGRLVFHVFAALAEFIRELIVEGTREGLDAARACGAPGAAPGHDRRADPARPRPAEPAGQHRLLHRPAARRQPRHHLQVRPGGHHRAPGCCPASRTGVAGEQLHVLRSHSSALGCRAGQVSRKYYRSLLPTKAVLGEPEGDVHSFRTGTMGLHRSC
jgi:DNA invertase Pin-like site-specific DNA recombinase